MIFILLPRRDEDQICAKSKKHGYDLTKRSTRLVRAGLNSMEVQIKRAGDSLPSAHAHKEFAEELVEYVRTKLALLPHEGVLTLKPIENPTLSRYVKSLEMEHCSFYSSWMIDLDFGWVGVYEKDLLMYIHKKLSQRYEPKYDALWLFLIGQHTMSRTMGWLSVSKLKTYHQLTDELETSQYQMVWLCDWNIVRWVRSQGWEEVVALGQEV